MQDFDVVIVGAGVAGLVTAIDMARSGLQVALIEKAESVELNEQEHVRVSAINMVSERILTAIGIWDNIPDQWKTPFREIAVTDADGAAQVVFSYKDIGRSYLGHIVTNKVLIKHLLMQAKQLSSFSFFCPAQIQAFHIESEHVKIKLMSDQILKAKLLVAADGANSWIRNSLKIPLVEIAYNHCSIVATVKMDEPHQSVARQRFMASGPIAFLPLNNAHECSIVWSTLPEEAKELMSENPDTLAEKIAATLDSLLGKITVIDKPLMFPLTMRHATHYVHPRVALIGDAAHTIHPLAGQGMNLGILDAACLSEVVVANFKAERDMGLVQNLRRYERWRRSDNQLMIDAMAFFKQGFAVQTGFLPKLRDLTLRLTNNNRWLRKIFMHNAMGYRGELPQIAKSEGGKS